jgi:CheY-like chemotaxis protein
MSLAPSARALVAESDAALADLLAEWLAERGYAVARDAREGRFDVIVTDVPDLRAGGAHTLRPLAEAHPDTPILALSSSFLAGVEADSAVARWLGVAGVLAKPVTRDALLGAIDRMRTRAA